MNPNSGNQRWSRWTLTIRGGANRPTYPLVRDNAARFARSLFRSATEMRVEQGPVCWTLDIRSEGHPVHDPTFVHYVKTCWTRWAEYGFGKGVRVNLVAKLEAGSRQDGTPADQLIIAPPLSIDEGVQN